MPLHQDKTSRQRDIRRRALEGIELVLLMLIVRRVLRLRRSGRAEKEEAEERGEEAHEREVPRMRRRCNGAFTASRVQRPLSSTTRRPYSCKKSK
jgi:hypothetical protein